MAECYRYNHTTGRPHLRLGGMINKGHKFWEWRFDGESLFHLNGNMMDIYAPLGAMGNNCNNNRWTCSLRRQPRQDTGYPCLVTINANGEVAIRLQAEVAHPETPPHEVLGSSSEMEAYVDVG
jgi:hypothetical protein